MSLFYSQVPLRAVTLVADGGEPKTYKGDGIAVVLVGGEVIGNIRMVQVYKGGKLIVEAPLANCLSIEYVPGQESENNS